MARAFVIILHTGWDEDHFDLLLESAPGEALRTWRLGRSCLALRPGESMPAVRLADHRRAYLTYEGPVSGGRGEVRRIASGAFDTILDEPARLRVRLDAAGETGEFELTRTEGNDWVITRRGQ